MTLKSPHSPENITEILRCASEGDKEAECKLISAVYAELHAMAAGLMYGERRGHTLQPTALVNEAYVRLIAKRNPGWQNRTHFFSVAAEIMRHILVDYARQRLSRKRGGGTVLFEFDIGSFVAPGRLENLLILEDALTKLEQNDPRSAKVVVYHIFGGLSIDEIAGILKMSTRSIKRDLSYGRAWLKAELAPRQSHVASRSQPC